jgi:solute:Na+ symporter, SSS family
MGVSIVDYIAIIFYLLMIVGLGVYFSKFMKGSKDFFVGGNMIPWWAAGVSLYMTGFSAWMFTGAASFIYNTGWFGILYLVSQPLSFFFGFLFTARPWRRSRISSPVEYIKGRFNRTTQLLLSIMMALSLMYWPAHHLASLSKISAPTLFPGSMAAIDIMIVVFGILVLIYTFSGGLWAVCVTDVVQFLILIVVCAVVLAAAFLSGDVGSLPDFLHSVPKLEFHHVIRGKTSYTHWYLIGVLTSHVFGAAIGDKAQRYYSVKDEKAARKVGWTATLLWLTGPLMFGIPPLIGKVLWPEIGSLPYFSDITKPDENIYIAVVMRYMPLGVVGIFLSAMMAASMSALDSVWNTVSSIISIDLYKNIFKPSASEKEVMRVGRITIVFLAIVAVVMALTIIHSDYGVFTFSNIFFALTGVPIAIPLFLGLIVKGISRWSAFSSILAGTLTASVARFVLHYSIGEQYLITIVITCLFILSSRFLGRAYYKSKFLALGYSLLFGGIVFVYFMTMDLNPNLSFARFFESRGYPFYMLVQFWAVLSVLALIALAYMSAWLASRDFYTDNSSVEAFFKKMATPVDVEKEVLKGKEEITIFPLVGGIAMAFSLMSLLILIAPEARTKIWVNITISVLLFLIGLAMFLSDPKLWIRIRERQKRRQSNASGSGN